MNGFQVTERTALYSVVGIAKVQRGITKRIYTQELWFLRSAHRLMLVNISMTFHEDILNGVQVIELQSGRHCILFLAFFTNDLTPIGRIKGILRKSLSRLTTSRAMFQMLFGV